jgi:hypothetical protein
MYIRWRSLKDKELIIVIKHTNPSSFKETDEDVTIKSDNESHPTPKVPTESPEIPGMLVIQ